MTGSAKQSSSSPGAPGLLRCARNDTDTVSRSRDMNCPRFCISFALVEVGGRREDRVRAAPAVPCAVCAWKRGAHGHTGSAEASRPSLRNGFTACFVLFPENGSFASVACVPSRKLGASTATPEPHDFTVRFRRVRLFAPSASIASHRAFVTFASAPHCRETGGVMALIWVRTEAEYF
jgi:hypothetical protein